MGIDQTAAARGDRVSPAEVPWLALLAAVLGAGLSALLAGLWRRRALREGWLDLPGQRSSHVHATPRGGGVGMAVVLVLAALLLPLPPGLALALAGSLLMVAVLGLVDDRHGLPAGWKLLGQMLAAAPLACALAPALATVFPVAGNATVVLAGVVAAAGLVFLVNAWNFMDGIDGIAALSAMGVGLVALAEASAAPAWLGLALVVAAGGFLPWNLPRARLFMGDAGSHVLGLAVGALLLLSLVSPEEAASLPVAAWALLAACLPFSIDVLATLLRRARDGEPLATAHRRHLYQLAVRRGYSHGRVALAYGGLGATLGYGVGMIGREGEGMAAAACGVAALALILFWVLARRRWAPGLEGEARA